MTPESALLRNVFVENGANLASVGGSAAWLFDASSWGICGLGPSEQEAIEDLKHRTGDTSRVIIEERIAGDEQAFGRDGQPCTEDERERTLEILRSSRQATLHLIGSCTDRELDFDDPGRVLPSFARWRTLRAMAWHVADTESRYYLPCLGLPDRERSSNLVEELLQSADHVRKTVRRMPADLTTAGRDGVWTSVKLLRRLAWHERSELDVMRSLLASARRAGG